MNVNLCKMAVFFYFRVLISLCDRYGMHLKLCNSSSDATENLTYFHKQLGLLFKDRQKTAIKSDMRILFVKIWVVLCVIYYYLFKLRRIKCRVSNKLNRIEIDPRKDE